MSEQISDNKTNPEPQLEIELSYRKEKKGYTVFVHNRAEKSIAHQMWYKGKRTQFIGRYDHFDGDVANVLLESARQVPEGKYGGWIFDGDHFFVRHAGTYTVKVDFADGSSGIAHIKIKRSRVLIIIVPLLVALGAGGAFWALNNHGSVPPKKPTGSAVSRLNDNGSADNGAFGTNRGQTASMITDHVASAIIAPTGTAGSEAGWYVENITKNTVIMQASVLKDGQQIAQTTPIKPGEHITQVKLTSDVPAGTYTVQAVLKYYTYDSAATYISEAVYKIKLQVK